MLGCLISVSWPRVLSWEVAPGPGLGSGGFGAVAYLVPDTADAAPGRGERLQVRLHLAGARLAAVQRGADTADARDVPGRQLGGEHALRFGAVAVQSVSGIGYRIRLGYASGYGCAPRPAHHADRHLRAADERDGGPARQERAGEPGPGAAGDVGGQGRDDRQAEQQPGQPRRAEAGPAPAAD